MASLATKSSRSIAAAGGLLFIAVASVLGFRGVHTPPAPDAPAYRQKGPADAAAVIVAYSDFQCPACGHAVETLKHLESLHAGDMRVIFKHRPWERNHPNAVKAAVAAECAGRQGRFWEFHDKLFASQSDWGHAEDPLAKFSAFAKAQNLKLEEFETCRADPATLAVVRADMKEADRRFVNSTPTFFVNGVRMVGARQLGTLGLKEIEKAAAAAEPKQAPAAPAPKEASGTKR